MSFSPREQQLIALIGRGKTARDAASDLGLTLPTVRRYLQGLYSKLGIHSRDQLIARATASRDQAARADGAR